MAEHDGTGCVLVLDHKVQCWVEERMVSAATDVRLPRIRVLTLKVKK